MGKNNGFQEVSEFVCSVKMVNDTAERGIKLIEDFAENITKNEDQLQWLYKNNTHTLKRQH